MRHGIASGIAAEPPARLEPAPAPVPRPPRALPAPMAADDPGPAGLRLGTAGGSRINGAFDLCMRLPPGWSALDTRCFFFFFFAPQRSQVVFFFMGIQRISLMIVF
jgi:hypothetical protein